MEALITTIEHTIRSLFLFMRSTFSTFELLQNRVTKLETVIRDLTETTSRLENQLHELITSQPGPGAASSNSGNPPMATRAFKGSLAKEPVRGSNLNLESALPVDSSMNEEAFRALLLRTNLKGNSDISQYLVVLHGVPSPLFDSWARLGDRLFASLLKDFNLAKYFGGNISNSLLRTKYRTYVPPGFNRNDENFGDMVESAFAWYVAVNPGAAVILLEKILNPHHRNLNLRGWVDSKTIETMQVLHTYFDEMT